MATKIRKFLAVMMAVSLFMTLVSMNALAEGTGEPSSTESGAPETSGDPASSSEPTVTGSGTLEDPKTTTTTTDTTHENGMTTTTTTTQTEAEGMTEEGVDVERTETKTEEVLKDQNGKWLEKTAITEGSETSTIDNPAAEATITVDLEEGETVVEFSDPAEPVTTGDLKEDENDMSYDQTTVTENPRKVEVTLGDIEITETTDGSGTTNLEAPEADPSLIDVNIPEKDIQEHEYNFNPTDSGNPNDYVYRYSGYGAETAIGVNRKDSNSDTLAHFFELTELTDQSEEGLLSQKRHNDAG